MKHLVAFAFVATYFLSFGQTDMFWNNYSNFNPAMSGFQYKQHAAIGAEEYWKSNKGVETINANFNQRIFGQHGVGINYTGNLTSLMNNILTLNYNYQFSFEKAGKLSTGIGIGAGRKQFKKNIFGSQFPTIIYPQNYFNLTLGAAYSWQNLIVGISTTNLVPPTNSSLGSPFTDRVGINIHSGYAFQLGENYQLTPRIFFASQNGYQLMRFNLTTTFKNKYSLGLSARSNDNFGVNIGWDIKDKFRVAYMINQTFSKLSNGSGYLGHEFSIGYIIK